MQLASKLNPLGSDRRFDRLDLVALAAILIVAAALRLYGVDWDRGYCYTPHPDERAILSHVVELSLPSVMDLPQLLDADESPWNPRWFPYGSFPLYLLSMAASAYESVPGLPLYSPCGDQHDLRALGRVISALADVGTVAVVYLLARRMYGRREAVLGSLLVALAVIHIQLSHFFAVDTIATLCAVLAVYFMLRVGSDGRMRDSILAGVFVGLGLATKVSLLPIFLALATAHGVYVLGALRSGRGRAPVEGAALAAIAGLAAAMAVSLAVLFVAQPYMFLDWARFSESVTEQSEMVRRIRDYPYTRQYIDTIPYWYQFRQLSTWGLGWPLGLLALAGLAYAALRGVRPRMGAVYLAAGVAVPAAILILSSGLPAIVLATAVASGALLATLAFRSHVSWPAVIVLAWVVPYLLITGAFDVKFLRYLVPITPFLVLFGSRMLVAGCDRLGKGRGARPGRIAVAAAAAVVVAVAAFYAVAYTAVYRDEHPGVRLSQWLNENAEPGSLVLMEHWEEGLPDVGGFRFERLPLYETDTETKLRNLSADLAEADYLVLFSNRLYGTIPRLPERYPVSTEYYRLLFDGGLGYELAEAMSSYPRLAGVSFVDDSLARTDLATPAAIVAARDAPVVLDLGWADESFSVYDHPLGLVFENVGRLNAEAIRDRILEAAPADALERPPETRPLGLLMSPGHARSQREGGTWTGIVRAGSWTNDVPVLAWLLAVQCIALVTLPAAMLLFRPLSDRGYLLAKPLGILVVGLIVWLLASLRWMEFGRESVGVAVLSVAAVSAVLLVLRRRELFDAIRRRWSIFLVGEAVFMAAFLAFVLMRMVNPDLWHSHLGGEKPMDLAYLTAVLKSSYMPPYDPWFSDGYLNYYYMGQFLVATLIHATGIEPGVAFNLAVALFFALTVAGAFSIVYNLAEGTRLSRLRSGVAAGHVTGSRSAVLAGVAGAFFVAVIGNLDGAIQVGQGMWRVLVENAPFGSFDFWRSSRMMAPDPPGHEITEFPFFTFLFADLHAHMIAIPFTLLALGLALALVLGAKSDRTGSRLGVSLHEVAVLAVLATTVGALRLINAWDFPTYLLVGAGAVFLAAYLRNGGPSLRVLVEAAVKSGAVFAVGYLVFLPYHLSYETFFASVEPTTNQTVLWQFLAISGLFVFVIGSWAVVELAPTWGPRLEAVRRWAEDTVAVENDLPEADRRRIAALRAFALSMAVVVVGFVVSLVVAGWIGSTVPFALGLGLMLLVIGLRRLASTDADAPHLTFALLMSGAALALVVGLDFLRVEGDIDRMNSVFKFYIQVWVLLALAAAYLLWRLADRFGVSFVGASRGRKLWAAGLAALVLSGSVYTVLGTEDRNDVRFEDAPLTLDGIAYMASVVYRDERGDIDLSADLEGIRWLRENAEGSPVVLEASTPSQYRYRWNGRISVYTGLPTIAGWQWHQEQQRWDYQWAIRERIQDIDLIYETTDPEEALSLLRKYDVGYVYVGELERISYPGGGLKKFDSELSGDLEKIEVNDQVTIYRVFDPERAAVPGAQVQQCVVEMPSESLADSAVDHRCATRSGDSTFKGMR